MLLHAHLIGVDDRTGLVVASELIDSRHQRLVMPLSLGQPLDTPGGATKGIHLGMVVRDTPVRADDPVVSVHAAQEVGDHVPAEGVADVLPVHRVLIERDRVELKLPLLAESGNVVPVTVSVESPMTQADHVSAIHLFAEKNHLPRVLSVQLGPWNGKAVVKSRIRLAESQQVLAVAVMNDGSLFSAVADVEVTFSSCG